MGFKTTDVYVVKAAEPCTHTDTRPDVVLHNSLEFVKAELSIFGAGTFGPSFAEYDSMLDNISTSHIKLPALTTSLPVQHVSQCYARKNL